MPEPTTLALFFVAALALLLVPGPVVLYTVARSVHQGWRAGILSALAGGLGNFVHVLAATLGLSALLASSALAFSAVKYAGAVYLIYLGVHTLLSKDREAGPAFVPMNRTQIFRQGLLVSVLNPKTALFFLAFLPQFITPDAGMVAGQTLFLGLLFVVLGVCTDSTYALLAGTAGQLFKRNTRLVKAQRYVTGGVYIALGASAAFADTSRN